MKIDEKRILSYFKILSKLSNKNKEEADVIVSLLKEEFEKEKMDLLSQSKLIDRLLDKKININCCFMDLFFKNSIYFPSAFSNDIIGSIYKQLEHNKNKDVFEFDVCNMLENYPYLSVTLKEEKSLFPIIEKYNLQRKIKNNKMMLNFYKDKFKSLKDLEKKDVFTYDESMFFILSFLDRNSKYRLSVDVFVDFIEKDKIKLKDLDLDDTILSSIKLNMGKNSSEKIYQALKPILFYNQSYNIKSKIKMVPKSCYADYSNFLLNQVQNKNILNIFKYKGETSKIIQEFKGIEPLYSFLTNIYKNQTINLSGLNLNKKYFSKSNFKYNNFNISSEINNILLADKIKKMIGSEIDKKQTKKRKM